MKVVFLGWKRNKLKKYLLDCEKLAEKFVKKGYDLYTGGGDGFMKMGNKGAFNIDPNKSYGITTDCIFGKEGDNPYIKKDKLQVTKTFSIRKKLLFQDANILVFFPGGMGTLDEFTDIMNLIKTGEFKPVKIYLYGRKYWNSLISWFEFNKIKFPHQYITNIFDNVSDFDSIFNGKLQIYDNSEKDDTSFDELINKLLGEFNID